MSDASKLKVDILSANTELEVTINDALVINEILEVTGAVTLANLSAAGYVKNSASGVISTSDEILETDLPYHIDATKIADSTVTNEIFQYLNDGTPVTSSIQAQLNSIPPITPTINVPAGYIVLWPGADVPTGWLKCDGTLYSKTTPSGKYNNLFTSIVYSFTDTALVNGDSFAVPDLRGMFVRGWMPVGTTVEFPRDIGPRLGNPGVNGFAQDSDPVGSIQDSTNLTHAHGEAAATLSATFQQGGGNSEGPISAYRSVGNTALSGNVNGTRPPNISLMYIIKY